MFKETTGAFDGAWMTYTTLYYKVTNRFNSYLKLVVIDVRVYGAVYPREYVSMKVDYIMIVDLIMV